MGRPVGESGKMRVRRQGVRTVRTTASPACTSHAAAVRMRLLCWCSKGATGGGARAGGSGAAALVSKRMPETLLEGARAHHSPLKPGMRRTVERSAPALPGATIWMGVDGRPESLEQQQQQQQLATANCLLLELVLWSRPRATRHGGGAGGARRYIWEAAQRWGLGAEREGRDW